MAALDLLLVGPAGRSTGGVAQFLTEQRRHLPSSIDVSVHDDGTLEEAFTETPARAMASAAGSIAEFATRDPPDVVHVHSSHGLSFYRAAAYVCYASAVWDAGVVVHVHGSSFDDFLETDSRFARRVQSAVFEASDAIVVLSEYWRRAFEGHVAPEKVHVVPNGVDVEDYQTGQRLDEPTPAASDARGDGGTPQGGPAESRAADGTEVTDASGGADGIDAAETTDAAQAIEATDGTETTDTTHAIDELPTLSFVSNHVPRKGIVELVEAVERLQSDGTRPFEVRFAGDGPAAEHAESLAARSDRVEYLGYVSEEEKRSLLAESTIYALPSHAEGLPIALLEGMATGNAVVSTSVGSIPEVVDEENGRLVSPGDVDELTEALEWLIEHPERARRMGERNARLVREQYSWDAVIDRLVETYETVTDESVTDESVTPDGTVALGE